MAAFARPFLAAGARVALVAPASPFDPEHFEAGVARLRERYTVSYDERILQRRGYLAGDDDRRLRELQHALDADEIDGILCARGGYGATRLLSRLDLGALARRPKLLVGFSDITALHARFARYAVASVHGMMVASLGTAPATLALRFLDAIEGRYAAQISGLSAITPGRARGRLAGGNLTVLTALLGTPYFPELAGCVLFLEDAGERPYRVDRMLTSWLDAGVLEKIAGVSLGAFQRCEPGPDGVTVDAVLRERLSRLHVPIVRGVPAGHLDDNLELPLGTEVSLDAERGELRFEHEVRT